MQVGTQNCISPTDFVLCIMAHSPKAFLMTFHLLVRKSHYQHKMNFLKLEAYPLLARTSGNCCLFWDSA